MAKFLAKNKKIVKKNNKLVRYEPVEKTECCCPTTTPPPLVWYCVDCNNNGG